MGPAMATDILLKSDLCNRFKVSFLNTKANDSITTLGEWSIRKVFRNFYLYMKMVGKMIANRPDVVLIPISQTSTGFIKDAVYILIAYLFGGKVIVQLRGSNFKNWIDTASSLVKKIVSFTLKRTKGVIVLGNNLRYLFKEYFSDDRIYVVPNGADYVIPPSKVIKEKEFRILFLSNLLSSKGITDVFDAINILNEAQHTFSVDFIGEWLEESTKSYCLDLVERKKMPVRIHSSEASKNKFQYLADASVFVFPPREPEGHPWCIVEAMAAALPIITTDQGAIAESIEDGVNGFIVQPKHPEQIAEKLVLLMENRDLRKKMSEASRNLYLQKFTEEKMIEQMSNVFYQTINRHS
jgi:glycosyltransferase involved in cell wall biosynthesis